jgi:hypothetical protein
VSTGTEKPIRRRFAFSGPWGLNRIVLLVGGICFLIAALSAADILNQVGPDLAWAFGGFSAWILSGAI